MAAPMFVSDIAHVSIRGTLGTFFQFQITLGILLEYLLGKMLCICYYKIEIFLIFL